MFLKYLSEQEQQLFLELCNLVIKADLKIEKEELDLINEYRFEMGLFEEDYQIKGIKYEEIVKGLKEKSNFSNIKKIMFELIALVKVDKKEDDREIELLEKLKNDFNLDSDMIKSISSVLDELKNVYKKVFDIVG
ncbi:MULTISPECIES: hypothetical protein [Caloramator]|uniref:Tellurite resistance protein TerB n=1 Tax=Caloramator proteoclasticus DSM 10124 TaxID=1121262 RepID=A0A1M4VU42_9CLOT|nr:MULTISPECIES: hypothetical protein [Caloramator]SHE72591.1 hypothetical protein SAMN02746091_00994 [Caloramator proteoclasticus DSM 10124]